MSASNQRIWCLPRSKPENATQRYIVLEKLTDTVLLSKRRRLAGWGTELFLHIGVAETDAGQLLSRPVQS